ncbi:hypothetical protein LJ737_17820 [Hymenobacter sp. 15J16-1T3B]|uniref:hypothetical protein n=1 Tax=Hymenobacter sp. 15J16-1T3B TaxID=2886941 RepID=UPI001D12EC14|nr:hypothetical protein [Hymenobacter sp. 15J16-1T3B]MCC3159104.1 hypothetical protein [Hymenobacter sp. 15J16-1T3B]
MNELANSPSAPAPAAAPPPRAGHWSLHLLGLAVSVAAWLWCVHWLSKADLSAPGRAAADTVRYTRAVALLLPASGAICFCASNVLRRGRWLLWLAGLLWLTACLVLVGVFGLLRTLGEATTTRTALLALGVGLSAAASFVAFWRLRRTRP